MAFLETQIFETIVSNSGGPDGTRFGAVLEAFNGHFELLGRFGMPIWPICSGEKMPVAEAAPTRIGGTGRKAFTIYKLISCVFVSCLPSCHDFSITRRKAQVQLFQFISLENR